MNYRCAACGKVITTPGNTKYCSKKCRSESPPKVVHIQNRYKTDIVKVITEILNRTDRVSSTADILGIDRGTLYIYLHRYNIAKKGNRWTKNNSVG